MVGHLPGDGPMRGALLPTDGKYLSRSYKEHLSGYGDWEQKGHAGEWVLLEQNMGERLGIDETMLHHDLFTFLSNKDGHCKKGTLIAAVKGTTVAEVTERLDKIPKASRQKVKEVTMDFSDSMMSIVKKEFPQAEIVIDLFHVMQLYGTKWLDAMRMKLKRANATEVKRQEREFKKILILPSLSSAQKMVAESLGRFPMPPPPCTNTTCR